MASRPASLDVSTVVGSLLPRSDSFWALLGQQQQSVPAVEEVEELDAQCKDLRSRAERCAPGDLLPAAELKGAEALCRALQQRVGCAASDVEAREKEVQDLQARLGRTEAQCRELREQRDRADRELARKAEDLARVETAMATPHAAAGRGGAGEKTQGEKLVASGLQLGESPHGGIGGRASPGVGQQRDAPMAGYHRGFAGGAGGYGYSPVGPGAHGGGICEDGPCGVDSCCGATGCAGGSSCCGGVSGYAMGYTGVGDYALTANYQYVGAGMGQFSAVPIPARGCSCWWSLCFLWLFLIPFLCWPSSTTTTSTTTPCPTPPTPAPPGPTPPPPGPPGTCRVYGDPHIQQFDGGHASFYPHGTGS
ncbi:unnamed protein product [Prorocentrum cordatum]|uniref:VWFD domain-containing protein n=1 Tax=Prorocentrum cordatum TaxID=2364126 RepID=A0ABN9WH78_9DINO|nr:unnamed protein product [Polarella glacialis]